MAYTWQNWLPQQTGDPGQPPPDLPPAVLDWLAKKQKQQRPLNLPHGYGPGITPTDIYGNPMDTYHGGEGSFSGAMQIPGNMFVPTITKLASGRANQINWYDPLFDIGTLASLGTAAPVSAGVRAGLTAGAATLGTVGQAGQTATNWNKMSPSERAVNLGMVGLGALGTRGALKSAFNKLPQETQDAILAAAKKPTLDTSPAMGITPGAHGEPGMPPAPPEAAPLNSTPGIPAPASSPKEPWQMTRDEFGQQFYVRGTGASPSGVAKHPSRGLASKASNVLSPETWRDSEPFRWSALKNPTDSAAKVHLFTSEQMNTKKGNIADWLYPRRGEEPAITIERRVMGDTPPHEYLVKQALAEGKPVPPEVLKDYPDLTKQPSLGPLITPPDAGLGPGVPAGQARATAPITPEAPNVPSGGPSVTGGIPPQPPVKPPTAAGAVPSPTASTPSIDRALSIAEAVRKLNKPGAITRGMLRVPGLKQVRTGLQPSLDMPEHIHRAYIAEGITKASVGHQLSVPRADQLRSLSEMFGGDKVVTGDMGTSVKFIGSAEQAAYHDTGKLWDVIGYPELYDLTPQQRIQIDNIGMTRDASFGQVKNDYNLKVGQFPRRPGAVFLPNYDASDTAEEIFGSIERAAATGRGKERFYEGARERWAHSVEQNAKNPKIPIFQSDTNVVRGLQTLDDSSARMAATATYRTGAGGKTKLDVMQELHPDLAAKMQYLVKRLNSLQGTKGRLTDKQSEALNSFLSSPIEDADLTALHTDLAPSVSRGQNVGKGISDVDKELQQVQSQIAALRPSWRVANLSPYQRVQEAGNLLWKADEASHIKRLAERSNNWFLRLIDNLRSSAFGGDASPVTIQGAVAWLSDPVGVSQTVVNMVKSGKAEGHLFSAFTKEGMLRDMQADPAGWQRYAEATSSNPLGNVSEEFGVGLLGKIPKIGPKWDAFNEAVYMPLKMMQKKMVDASYNGARELGLSEQEAMAIAGDDATKLIPQSNSRILGQSPKQAALYRAALTSVSFLTQPVALMSDAAKGFAKLGLRQTVSPTEKFAMRRVTTLAATVEAISVLSGVVYAKTHNQDEGQAVKDALNPASGKFMSLILPNGARISMGGPMRSIIKGIAPDRIPGVPVPMPFAHIDKFILGKMGPVWRVGWDEARNKDFFGKRIRSGDFPMNVLRGLGYAAEGVMPLTLGGALQQVQRGDTASNILQQAGSQFMGTNLSPSDPAYQAKLKWGDDLKDYNLIPMNTAERMAQRLPSRDDYRKRNPEVDAKLFLIGDVKSLQSPAALQSALNLAQQEGIDLRLVPGVRDAMTQRAKEQQLGVKPGPRTLVDTLVQQLTANQSKRLSIAPTPPPSTPTTPFVPKNAPDWMRQKIEERHRRSSLTPQQRAAFVMAQPDYHAMSFTERQQAIRQAVAA